jgi:hypothetical protein
VGKRFGTVTERPDGQGSGRRHGGMIRPHPGPG